MLVGTAILGPFILSRYRSSWIYFISGKTRSVIWGAPAELLDHSGGERQRVKLARGFAQDAACMILDEPESHLDWNRRLELYRRLRVLARERGKCVVMICHDLLLAPGEMDAALLLYEGGLAAYGPPDAVLSAANLRRYMNCTLEIRRGKTAITVRRPNISSIH